MLSLIFGSESESRGDLYLLSPACAASQWPHWKNGPVMSETDYSGSLGRRRLIYGVKDKFDSGGHAELVEHPKQIIFHRVLTKFERSGDFFIR
jgi:hypothetical protein